MRVFKIILLVLIFACLAAGIFMAVFSRVLVSKRKNTNEVAERKRLKIKLIGYVLMLSALAIAIFRGLLK